MPPLSDEQARSLLKLRHREYERHVLEWQWLLDSLEGGRTYRDAQYGSDRRGYVLRNLVRHKHELPNPGDPYALTSAATALAQSSALGASQYAADDDYEMRRARTPVPTFVREAIEVHLSKIYAKEVRREGPDALQAWWEDVDGKGSSFADWVEQEAAPLFLALGQLDVLIDHPPAEGGAAAVRNRADEVRLGLNRAVVSVVLPGNLLWWKILPSGRYGECLVRERDDEGREQYRFWTAEDWTLIDAKGKVTGRGEHPFGRVPVERFLYRRKPNCDNVGESRYYGTAEKQREYYNRDSELILSDSTQAHPLMQGPEDYVQADGTMPIGPNWMVPMKKNMQGASVSYQGFEVIDFPKGAADSIRQNKQDIRDDCDRENCLTKPAGVAGTDGKTVGQSAAAKSIDNQTGHDLITQIAGRLQKFELGVQRLALCVLSNGPPSDADYEATAVEYPTSFDLQSPAELSQGLTDFQAGLGNSGQAPDVEVPWLQKLVRQNLRGQSQEDYDAYNAAIEEIVRGRAEAMANEPAPAPAPVPVPAAFLGGYSPAEPGLTGLVPGA